MSTKGRTSPEVYVVEETVTQPGQQTWKPFTTTHQGLTLLKPTSRLYENHLSCGRGDSQRNRRKDFPGINGKILGSPEDTPLESKPFH